MTESWSLGAPEYAALFTFFTVMLVGLNLAWAASVIVSRKSTIIRELQELTELAERFLYKQDKLSMKDAARSRVLYRKYQAWLPGTEVGKPGMYHYKAARCAALLQVHGYIRGRWEIWRKNRK